MKSSGLIFWLVVLFLFSGTTLGVLLYRMAQRDRAPEPGGVSVVDPDSAGPAISDGTLTEFTLTTQNGEKFSSTELDGDVWLASFFFARCPRECSQMNRHIQELQREFGNKGVKFVSISCDPNWDTPAVLARYAQRFNADPEKWVFLTGDQEYIGRVGLEMFKVPVYNRKMQPAHTGYLMVVDRAGQLHYFNWSEPDEFAKLKTALDKFLAQTPEEARENFEQGEGQEAAQQVEGESAEPTDEASAAATEPEAAPAEEAAEVENAEDSTTEANPAEEPAATM